MSRKPKIEISRTLQLIDLKAEWELRGYKRCRHAARQKHLAPRSQYLPAHRVCPRAQQRHGRSGPVGWRTQPAAAHWRQDAGRTAAQLHAEICDGLRDQGYTPLAYRAVTMPPRISCVRHQRHPTRRPAKSRTAFLQHLMGRAMPAPVVPPRSTTALGQLPSQHSPNAAPPPPACERTHKPWP